jgi:biopolymer transport protein ExbD
MTFRFAGSDPLGEEPIGEINVTPLVDVMLVLLIIFIVTAPLLLMQAVPVALPQAAATAPPVEPRAVVVSIDAQARWHVGPQPVGAEQLAATLRLARERDPQVALHLHADERVAYREVARVLAIAAQAGIGRVLFVTRDERR